MNCTRVGDIDTSKRGNMNVIRFFCNFPQGIITRPNGFEFYTPKGRD